MSASCALFTETAATAPTAADTSDEAGMSAVKMGAIVEGVIGLRDLHDRACDGGGSGSAGLILQSDDQLIRQGHRAPIAFLTTLHDPSTAICVFSGGAIATHRAGYRASGRRSPYRGRGVRLPVR